jgi:hypothetical protein
LRPVSRRGTNSQNSSKARLIRTIRKKPPSFQRLHHILLMKKNPRSTTARATVGTLLVLSSIALLCAIPLSGSNAGNQGNARPVSKSKRIAISPDAGPNPASGAISVTDTSPVTWVGTTISAGGNQNTESTCMENSPLFGCETFTLTVNGTPADWAGKKIQVLLTWQSLSNEYDLYIHKGSNSNPVVTSAVQGPGLTQQFVFIDPATAGTGVFTVHVVYDTTPASATDPYHGSVSVFTPTASGSVPLPAPADTGPKVGYENFEAPGLLTGGTATSSGGVTVEYMGRGAGEPSVGSNWNTGVANFQSDLETLFITFDDSCSLANPKATWVNRRAPSSVVIDSDPIGFTDRQTGRVFAAELTLLSPDTVKISHSDDDGVTWVGPDQPGGFASAVDHETIGGGPYNPNSVPPPPPPTVYPNAVYYCSQDIGAAFCARSDDGGVTYSSQVPIYPVSACGGLHGHVKVAPDGTVYVPNRSCGNVPILNGGISAVVVSTDNGITWTVRPVQNGSVPNTPASDDPAVAIDAAGKVYCLFAQNGTTAAIGMSTDQGQTWKNIYEVGSALGLQNIAFPAAVAGDAGRAAVAFYGSVTGTGDSSANGFTGVWHLFVSHTFDGGNHWTTSDVTPTLPMQRMGLLRGGGGPMDRNLLDFFDITIDRDGRVLVGYVNGCSGGNCAQAPIAGDGSNGVTGNAYTATATIARQSSGRRMLAAKDPANPLTATSVPGMPFVTQTRIGNVVRLAWNEADTGNSPLLVNSGYQILRGTSSGNEVPLGSPIPGNSTSYTDTTATDATKTYYYKVVATNAVGSSCPNNEIAAPFVGDTCSGVIIHRNLPTHPESTGGTVSPPPLPQYLIDYIAVGEPPATNQLMFRMKVGSLTTLPPNSRWRMVWNTVASPDEQFYVGMTTDQNSAPTFEYGTLPTVSVPPVVGVLGVPTENPLGAANVGSNFNADGTITILIDKSKVGNPQPGDLLGAVNGRTFNTGDTPPQTLERSNLLIDHTFVKGNVDNSFPVATYTVTGNTICSSGNIEPVSAVSRKTHGSAGDFDIDLPLTGAPGIECRTGPTAGNHTAVITFSVPVSVSNVTVTPGAGGTAAIAPTNGFTVNNTQVTVNLTNVSNAQTLTINLLGVTGGAGSGDVAIPMSVLLGDVSANGLVNSTDISQTQAQSGQAVTLGNFRTDVNANGLINSTDITTVQSKSGTGLH